MKDTTITCTTTNGNGNGVIGAAEASELDLRGASEEVLALAASINATNRRVVAEITEAKAEGPELTASEIPILSASEIPWDEPVASTRDRTLEGRLLRAIATGEGLEHPSPHLAAVQAFLDKHPPGCDVYGAESEFRDLLRFDVPKLSEDDWHTYRKQLAKGSGWRASHLDKQRREARRSAVGVERDEEIWASHAAWPDPVDRCLSTRMRRWSRVISEHSRGWQAC